MQHHQASTDLTFAADTGASYPIEPCHTGFGQGVVAASLAAKGSSLDSHLSISR